MNRKATHIDKNIVDVGRKRSASDKAVRDFRTRLSIVGTSPLAYELELLKGFATNQVNATLAIVCLIIVVTAFGGLWLGFIPLIGWATMAIIAHIGLCIMSARFLKEEVEQEQLSRWRHNFLYTQLGIAAAWTTLALIPYDMSASGAFPTLQFSAILAFNAAVSMMSYSFGRGALIMTTPATLTLAVLFVLNRDTTSLLMAMVLLGSIGFFYFITVRLRTSLMGVLEHSTEKETLIVELETEKAFSEQARKRAEEANFAKSRFLATMSHELRTPLNAILGFSEIMRDEVLGPIGNDSYREYSNDIHRSGSHLLKLINEILDISRIEAGKHELKEEKLSLIDIAEEARHMMNVKAQQKNVELITSYEDSLTTVWVDQQAIRQIVLNLLSNALKFTPTGGKITLKIGWTAKGGQYISIKDTGPGISPEEIPVVLSSFGQGSIAIKHAEPGTGLGLSIVQALLHVHQGKFDLKSELRKGTEAIAYLPLERVTVARKNTQLSEPASEAQALSVNSSQDLVA